jgi:uncharacterized membrane protein
MLFEHVAFYVASVIAFEFFLAQLAYIFFLTAVSFNVKKLLDKNDK